mmetsp:Transcript_23776/g.28162  ORF Transcript_23776/g.28162 Transcript_23776/m.28162 type:complete len:82 (+) Transcript_23776:114-359(+)
MRQAIFPVVGGIATDGPGVLSEFMATPFGIPWSHCRQQSPYASRPVAAVVSIHLSGLVRSISEAAPHPQRSLSEASGSLHG